MTEMTATGGIILLSIAVSSLLELRKIRSANFLPALLIAPLVSSIADGVRDQFSNSLITSSHS